MRIEIEVDNITDIQASVKVDELGLKTILKIETRIPPQELARILNLSRQGAPIHMLLVAETAQTDLQFTEFGHGSARVVADKLTGEILSEKTI